VVNATFSNISAISWRPVLELNFIGKESNYFWKRRKTIIQGIQL
jgi:hypothetical protein